MRRDQYCCEECWRIHNPRQAVNTTIEERAAWVTAK